MIYRQKGFTLVELAMGLVLMSLIILGVIKGQSLIENAKIQNLIKEFDHYENIVYMYTVSNRRAPGGYNTLARSGSLSYKWDQERFWKDLRKEGLIDGDPNDGTSPVHTFGDPVKDVFEVRRKLASGKANIDEPFVFCAKNIKREYAEAIDQKIDDGDTSTWSGNIYIYYGGSSPLVRLCKQFIVGRRG
jgi:prepilin-type N-terminal cleavage/methylation domain-containing protein